MFRKTVLTLAVITLGAINVSAQAALAAGAAPSASPKGPDTAVSNSLAADKKQPIKMPRFEKAPVIDGKLDDEVWKQAVVLKDFHQVQPGDNIAPSRPTEVLLGFDSKFLYIAFHCYDEPDKVRATIAKRDDIFGDDYVGILFDTFNDKRKAYEFDFNPLGVQADGVWVDGQNEDFSPDLVLESKGVITGDGWTLEVAIPFKSLRYVAGKDRLWGVHFWRRIKRFNNELDMWMPISRDTSSWLAQEGHLSGLEGISTERTLELIPSLTLSETGTRKATLSASQLSAMPKPYDPGRFVNEPLKFDPGLTGKYTITPNMVLDFAINPDFAQVESDQLVVTANQRFPIFFEEKRPFFLEGKDIFDTQISAVHTRTIVDPQFAVKLTGKIDRNTFGLLVARDDAPGNFSPEEALTADPRQIGKSANVGIVRAKRDIGSKDSFIGFLGTYRRFVDQYNILGGFDSRLRINKQTTFSAQALLTQSREDFFYPDQGQTLDRREKGFAYAFDYNADGRHFGYDLSGVGRTEFFRSDLGFNRRVNTNSPNGFFRYNSEPKPKAKLISWRVYDDVSMNFDWQGHSQNVNNEAQVQFNLRRQTSLGVGFDRGYERLFEREFGAVRQPGQKCVVNNNCTFFGADGERSTPNHAVYMFFYSTPAKKYDVGMSANHVWNAFDFDFGAPPKFPRVSPSALLAAQASSAGLCGGLSPSALCNAPLDPGPGRFFHFDAQVNYKPTNTLRATLSYTKERLVRNDTGRLAFSENIISLRATYQFSRFVFARGRIDYDSIASNIKGQFLFGWTPNPGTAFYVGYNDDVNRNGFNPFTGQLEPGFRQNGRTFFIKMSYLFRKSFG
jgi:Domain of unknown function (DUF5916)/Carbohydrate family 9 binding domain-like